MNHWAQLYMSAQQQLVPAWQKAHVSCWANFNHLSTKIPARHLTTQVKCWDKCITQLAATQMPLSAFNLNSWGKKNSVKFSLCFILICSDATFILHPATSSLPFFIRNHTSFLALVLMIMTEGHIELYETLPWQQNMNYCTSPAGLYFWTEAPNSPQMIQRRNPYSVFSW